MVSVGDTLQGRYRILRLLGEGAMGAVYEGEHLLIHRRVAIKVLHAYAKTEEAAARFEREAQAAGQIDSDHITEVLDLGRLDDGDHFIVMEYLTGETLGARYQRLGRLRPEQLVPLVRQVLVGLAAAHDAGIVHRDIKPENLFVLSHKAGQRDFVKILDFGVSKFREKDERGALVLTGAGSMMGTPCYMAPEQARGQGDAGVPSDLYAVGVVLYEGLTGTVPFDGNNLNELLFKIVEGRFVPPRELVPELDVKLDALVRKALAYAPEQRFQSADELIDALDDWTRTHEAAAARRLRTPPPVDAGVASTSPTEHSLTLPRAGGGGRLGGWATLLGLVLCGASVLVYRSSGAPERAAPASAGDALDGERELEAVSGSVPLEAAPVTVPSTLPTSTARVLAEQGASTTTTEPRAAEGSAAPSAKPRAARARPRASAAAAKPRAAEGSAERAGAPASAATSPEASPPRAVKARPDWGY